MVRRVVVAGVLAVAGCSVDAAREPEVAVLVPTTEEGYVDDWHTAEWSRAGTSDDDVPSSPSAETPPETLALVDDQDDRTTAPWPCESVNTMREVLQWANTAFSEGSKGTVDELPDNFRTAVANAQSRDTELAAATASAAESRPELAADFETLRDRHLWTMSEFEQIGLAAGDAYDINRAGLDLFESSIGVEWATRAEAAKLNIDDQLVPECGVSFDDPTN